MKKLLVYLKDYKKESILGPLFKLLEASFELLVPLVMAAVTGNRRTGQLHHRPVFCGEGGGWICDRRASCAVLPYSEPLLHRNGYTGDIDHDHADDQRCEPGPAGGEHDAEAVPAVSVYRVWRYGHGLYHQCEGSDDLRGNNPAAVDRGVRNYAVDHAPV